MRCALQLPKFPFGVRMTHQPLFEVGGIVPVVRVKAFKR
jgi:hypothetical protein